MHAIVHPANIQDRDGGVLVLGTLFGRFPFLKKLFADGGYQGPVFDHARKKILPHLETEIVKRSDTAVGFEVIPRRWVVERTFAWLGRCRRLAKDFENRTRTARAFLLLASIRLMLRKLCLNTQTSRTDSKGYDGDRRCQTQGSAEPAHLNTMTRRAKIWSISPPSGSL